MYVFLFFIYQTFSLFFFFFSSRRRHTRSLCDWSSDVCSSDLLPGAIATGSFLALAYAYAVRFLAPATASVEAGLGQVSDEMTASARTLGASPMRVLGRIHMPLSRASLLTAGLLVGVDALKELPLAYLLRPVGFDTLPVWVYNLASESRFEQAALPALTIIVAALLPVALLSGRLERR